MNDIQHHSLFIINYENLKDSQKDYSCNPYNYDGVYFIVTEYLKKGYGVIYAAEDELSNKIVGNISKATGVDAEEYVKNGQLTVMDFSLHYPSSVSLQNRNNDEVAIKEKEGRGENNDSDDYGANNVTNNQTLIKRWQLEIDKMKNNSYDRILIVSTCQAFCERNDYDGLIAYDNAINHQLLLSSSSGVQNSSCSHFASAETNIECICCYPRSAIMKITSLEIIKVNSSCS